MKEASDLLKKDMVRTTPGVLADFCSHSDLVDQIKRHAQKTSGLKEQLRELVGALTEVRVKDLPQTAWSYYEGSKLFSKAEVDAFHTRSWEKKYGKNYVQPCVGRNI